MSLCMPPYTFHQVKAWRHDGKSWIHVCRQCHVAALQSAMLDVPAIPSSVNFLCQSMLIYSRGDTRLECGPLLACQAHIEPNVGPDLQCHYLYGHECTIPWISDTFLSKSFRTFLKSQCKVIVICIYIWVFHFFVMFRDFRIPAISIPYE